MKNTAVLQKIRLLGVTNDQLDPTLKLLAEIHDGETIVEVNTKDLLNNIGMDVDTIDGFVDSLPLDIECFEQNNVLTF